VIGESRPGEQRQLLWFGGGVILGWFAEQTVMFAIPLFIYQNSGSVAYLSTGYVVEWLPTLVAYPFAGLMADRLGGRRTFLFANSVRALCLLITAAVCWRFPRATVVALMISGVLLSILEAPMRTAIEKMVPSLAGKTDLATRQSFVQNIDLLATVVAPGVAVVMAGLIGQLPLLLVTAGMLGGAALAWAIVLPRLPRSLVPQRIGADLLLGWQLLLRNRAVLSLTGVSFLVSFIASVVLSTNAYMITGLFHAADKVFGLMSTGAGLVGLLNLLFIPRLLRWLSVYQLAGIGYALICVGLLSMAVASNVVIYAAAFIGMVAGGGLYNVFNRTQRSKGIEPEHLGKVIGPFYLLNCLAYPLGAALMARLSGLFSVQHIFLSLVLLVAVPGALLLQSTCSRFRAVLAQAARPVPGIDAVACAADCGRQ